jgi:hypothetical protein
VIIHSRIKSIRLSIQTVHTASKQTTSTYYKHRLQTIHHKICHAFFLTATPYCLPQNMPCIVPYIHSILFTTKYAMYSSSQPLHTVYHKICHIFIIAETPEYLTKNMPCILPHSHPTILISKYAM